jgi:copper chaperone
VNAGDIKGHINRGSLLSFVKNLRLLGLERKQMNLEEKSVAIKGMTCGHCEGRVSKEILSIPGVIGVSASADNGNAIITSNLEISEDAIERAVQAAGYSLLR